MSAASIKQPFKRSYFERRNRYHATRNRRAHSPRRCGLHAGLDSDTAVKGQRERVLSVNRSRCDRRMARITGRTGKHGSQRSKSQDHHGETMTTLDAHMYGNPEHVFQRKQEAQLRKVAACGDCVNAKMIFQGQPFCTVKYQRFGFRCINYIKADK